MDKVLITGLLVTASVITVMILFGVFRTSIKESAGSAIGLQDQASLQSEIGITIMEVITIDNGTAFNIWAKNTGSIEINPIKGLVFAISDINASSYNYVEYSDLDPLIATQHTWRIVGGDRPWRPGETLQAQAKLILSPTESRDYILSINLMGDNFANHTFNAPSSLASPPQP